MSSSYRCLPRTNENDFRGTVTRVIDVKDLELIRAGKKSHDSIHAAQHMEEGMNMVLSDKLGKVRVGVTVAEVRQYPSFATLQDDNQNLPIEELVPAGRQIMNDGAYYFVKYIDLLDLPSLQIGEASGSRTSLISGMTLDLYDHIFPVVGNETEWITVHASDINGHRATINRARSSDEPGLTRAQKGMLFSTTSVRSSKGHEYEWSSVPLYAYSSAYALSGGSNARVPEFIVSDSGVELPWRGAPMIVTRGIEAIRCLLFREFGKNFAIYERQIIELELKSIGYDSIQATTICSPAITHKMAEASAALLKKDGDAALIGVFAPETACITSNMTVGWFVIEKNFDFEPVPGTSMLLPKDLIIGFGLEGGPLLTAICNYLNEDWRNFIHLRYRNGTQAVVYNEKYKYAVQLAKLPLRSVKFCECCDMGSEYLTGQIRMAAQDIIQKCTQHAIVRNKSGAAMFTVYDPKCEMRYAQMSEELTSNVDEQPGTIEIERSIIERMNNAEPQMVGYEQRQIADLLASGKTVDQIHCGFMERFTRAVMSSIYVCYGYTAKRQEGDAVTRPLAAAIYALYVQQYNSRQTVIGLIATKYDTLEKNYSRFGEALKTVWDTTKRLTKVPHLVALTVYIINRPMAQFDAVTHDLVMLTFE